MFYGRIGIIYIVVFAIGCGYGGPDLTKEAPPPPHGGTITSFPDAKGRGVIEIVKKSGTSPITGEVAFYFYEADDEFTPYKSCPETGVLVLDSKRKLTLQAEDGALMTPTGPALFANRDIDGELKFEIDGEPKVVILGVR